MARRPYKLDAPKAIDYVRERIHPSGVDSYRRVWERQWLRQAAFLNGKQNFVDDGARFRNPILPKHRVLYQANFIRSAVTRAVASVMATRAEFRSPPHSASRRDRYASFVAEKLFDHLREELKWEDKMEILLVWAATLGSSFGRLLWDPNAGPVDRYYLENMATRKPLLGLSAEEMAEKEQVGEFIDLAQGDLRFDVFNLFQFYWDWRMREGDLSTGMWVGTKELVDIPKLEDIFGYQRTKHIRPMEFESESIYFEELIAFMVSGFNSPVTAYSIPRDKQRNQTIVTELWEIPMRQNGNLGRHLIIAGYDVVLVNDENPYRSTNHPLPFFKMDWQIRPGAFVGHSLVEMLISSQFQYNRARATIVEHQNVYGHPSMFVPKNSQIPTGFMSVQPGVIYEWNAMPGVKPVEPGPVPTLSKEVAQNASLALQEMNNLSSQQDPDMSKLPGQIRGGPAMEMLLEEKNKVLMPTARRLLSVTRDAGRQMLSLAKTFYSGRRKLVYAGDDNEFKVLEFDRSNINVDLRIIGEPGYFRSIAAERARAMEMAQLGILNVQDPEDKVALLKALSFATPDEIIADRLADETNAEELMLQVLDDPLRFVTEDGEGGLMVKLTPQPWDNPQAHMRVLERLFKNRLEWEQTEPAAQRVLVEYYQRLQEKQDALLQAQAELAQSFRGAPGSKGVASQPSPAR